MISWENWFKQICTVELTWMASKNSAVKVPLMLVIQALRWCGQVGYAAVPT